ncbi:fasciclin domain-containing protein [Cellulophaga tyrosinoxydans]|uniref:Uncaracterized surface protein containing fasciclin (FAS1) repeats n=1 Tax=Cellulophaga tyrosinoxydans TaxID=504486 RepID=A0A1W1YQN3_9FLAO|nr:fasciclin domain-containing protein [Cellulophaga tyrosinoxydans]SMC38111.1 Uncaracterized surface protein containing fasciclin (FAS1) repeats [Cellulophaga tyrosinoxydans]
MKTLKNFKSISLALLLMASTLSFAQEMTMKKDKKMKMDTKMVGGAEMYPSKDIVSNAVNSKDHTTLVAAVKAADLVTILQSEGPFTVFAPTNAAFDKLPKGTVESLLMTENKEKLQSVLTYHVLAGKFSSQDLLKAIKKGKGKTELKTVQGNVLKFMLSGDSIKIIDANGNMSTITIADVNQSNGVIHVIDTVVLPGM